MQQEIIDCVRNMSNCFQMIEAKKWREEKTATIRIGQKEMARKRMI